METRIYSSNWAIRVSEFDEVYGEDLFLTPGLINNSVETIWNAEYTDLTPYIHEALPYVRKLDLTLKDKECLATVVVDDTVPRDADKNIMQYLEGQYADGFGEGLEEIETSVKKYTYQDFDEDDEPYEVTTRRAEYIVLWPDNFKIKRIK